MLFVSFFFFYVLVFCENDSNKRVIYLTQMAERGDKDAQTDLGMAYGEGFGVVKNYEKAAFWYSKAATQGSVSALFNLGLFYEKGWGVTKNLQLAREFYSKAAVRGECRCAGKFRGFLYKWLGREDRLFTGKKSIFDGCGEKNTVALYNLGYIYNYGLGIPRDEKQAAKWYGKAAELGSMSARNSLALYYSRGAGNLPVDRKRALDLLKSSACQGYAVAQNNLGILYLEGGDEISKDVRKSYAWFSVAFYNGIKTANEARKKIATYMDEKEAKEAENLAREYINNYPTSINGSDTNKSDSQCRLPAY